MKPQIYPGDPLKTLRAYSGYYECPKDASDKRLGPLVGYAGTYEDADGVKKQKVGEVYCNFAKADNHPKMLEQFAREIIPLGFLAQSGNIQAFCGAPLGGYSFSTILGLVYKLPVIKAEKKVVALATEQSREVTELVFARDQVEPDVKYAIVEDVCNNFSTTEKLVPLINEAGGIVSHIICLLNRSMNVDGAYTTDSGIVTPVTELVRIKMRDYRQDDPYVRDDIEAGNVVWKPKDQWDTLEKAMVSAV